MTVTVVTDPRALVIAAADAICEVVRAKPGATLGLPTGDTPVATYAELAQRVARGEADFSHATAFAIDEFAGVPRATPGTNAAFYAQHVAFPLAALRCPDASAADPDAEIATFARTLRDTGGLDLCVLGVGVNGHIAFNEPGSAIDTVARVVDLAPSSRESHARPFGGLARVPHRGMTLGVADILVSRRVLVLAHGEAKAAIGRRALVDPPSSDVPASWLQQHPNTTWLLDEAAARLMRNLKRTT